MNLKSTYICSVCGITCMGALTRGENGEYGCCPFCHSEMIDTNIYYGDFTSIVANDPDYQKNLIETIVKPHGKFDQSQYVISNMKIQKKRSRSNLQLNAITCPYCKSTNTKKISGTTRFVSTGFFGLASSKIGKQWHCNSCKSDF